MRATKFTLKESENLAKQMVIHRAYKKAINEQRSSSRPLQEIIAPSTPGAETTVSPLTETTTNTATTDSTPPPAPASTPTSPRRSPRIQQKKPKQLLTRKNSRAMQKHRINKLALSDFTKRKFKRATSWYARELKKQMGNQATRLQDSSSASTMALVRTPRQFGGTLKKILLECRR